MSTVKTDGLTAQNLLPPSTLGFVVLAGGSSTRMGVNKALLPVSPGREETLLDHAYALGQTILERYGQDVNQLFVSGEYSKYRAIKDTTEKCGPLGGVLSVLSYQLAQTQRKLAFALFSPVDMPDLSAELLSQLVEIGIRERRVCYFREFYLPFFLPIQKDIAERLMLQIKETGREAGTFSLRSFLAANNALEIETPKDFATEFINLNTPQEFGSWRSALSLKH